MKLEAEQIILSLVLIVLGVVAGIMGWLYVAPEQNVASLSPGAVEPFEPMLYDSLPESIKTVQPWKETTHKVFVPPLLAFYPDKGVTIRLSLETPDSYGINGIWKKKFGFQLDDPDVPLYDSDKDGFINLEEFKAGTNPTDPQSMPPPITKLRMVSYESKPFKLMFRGYSQEASGAWIFQLNFDKTSSLLHKGERFDLEKRQKAATGWKVGEFRHIIRQEKSPYTGAVIDMDYSELDLHHPLLDSRIVTLIRNRQTESDDRKVVFTSLLPGDKEMPPVNLGERFTFRNVEYQLVEASKEEALLLDIVADKKEKILLITEADKASMHPKLSPAEAAAAAAAGTAGGEGSPPQQQQPPPAQFLPHP